MATTTKTINVELTYTDYDTRTYKIPFNDQMTLADAKEVIQEFNAEAATEGSAVRQTFISDNGAPVASVNAATIVQRTEDVIYSVG